MRTRWPRWTGVELRRLEQMHAAGLTAGQMRPELPRHPIDSIRYRRRRIGLNTKPKVLARIEAARAARPGEARLFPGLSYQQGDAA